MAFYIIILKLQEDNDNVFYRFGSKEPNFGNLKSNKNSEKIEEIKAMPVENSSAFFIRAATKVYRHWQN